MHQIFIEYEKNNTQNVCLNVKHLFYKIQQKKNSSSDGATELDFFHVKYPEGSGCTKMKHLHLDKEKFSKCSLMFFYKIQQKNSSTFIERARYISAGDIRLNRRINTSSTLWRNLSFLFLGSSPVYTIKGNRFR